MGAFLAYNLKVSFCFVLFYILYKAVLSRNTFYKMNRRVLFFSYLVFLLAPVIDLRTPQSTGFYLFIAGYEQFFVQPNPAQIKWTDIIVSVYMAGILFFSLRYLYYTAKIVWILLNGEKVRHYKGRRVVITERNIAPFSWINHIVVSRNDFITNGEEIIAHESAHVGHGHFVDLFLAELFTIIQWYNPSIWLIKNELKDLHEYEADHSVLDSGFNPRHYQLLLIKKAVGSQRFNSMTNSLNHSKLKKRITMMLKEKSSPWAKMKYLTVLPLIAFALTVFARPEISGNLDKISEVKVSELSSIIETKIEEFSIPPGKNVEERPFVVVEKDSLSAEMREKIRLQMEEVRKQFDSEAWRQKVKEFELSAEMQEKIRQQMEEVRKQFDSEEWRQKVKEFELSAEMQEKLRQQMEEVRKQFESEEWKNQLQIDLSADIQKNIKLQIEEAHKNIEEALKRIEESEK